MITSPNQQEDNVLSHALSRRFPVNWELAAYILIFLFAVFTRFHMLDTRVMSHDESLHTRFSYNLYNEGNFQHTPLMHGPVLFHATAFSFFLFGDSDFTGRLYTAVLGVMMVMLPLLWRRWLGKWGALLACLMLLISPLLMYYNRYIRHDTPSIFFAMVMAHCILMYLDGPPRFRRRGMWLYLFAGAMILNLGSKETAFIYIAIFGSFLTIYFLVRLAQHHYDLRGRYLFQSIVLGILLGGVITLGMYIVVDIIPAEIIAGRGTPFASLSDLERSSWFSWMTASILCGVFVLVSTALYAFRDRLSRIPWREVLLILLLAFITAGCLLFIEELSHFPSPAETAEPTVPDSGSADALDTAEGAAIRWAPTAALWLIAIAVAVYLIRNARQTAAAELIAAEDKAADGSFWGFLYRFPEVDLLVLMLTLVLPWTTALFTRVMGGSSSDFAALAGSLPEAVYNLLGNLPSLSSAAQIGQFLVGLSVFAPLLLLSLVVGLTWNWKRWLISSAIFHILFAFFFTSAFTNIAGLGTGMIYSLGYWLEQQGVRRGSQPQYYYMLLIMPTYEFLPIIGSITAMFAGVTCFWKSRRKRLIELENIRRQQVEAELGAYFDAAADPDDRDTNTATAIVDAATAADTGDDETPSTSEREVETPPSADGRESAQDNDKLTRLPFLLLLAWWAILNLVGYSLAGEKMPWLGTHLTTPMILITAWYFGGVFSRISKSQFLARGWLALLLSPLFLVSLAQVLGALIGGDPPFIGLAKTQLELTYSWLASLIIALSLGYVLLRLTRQSSWMHIRRILAVAVFSLLGLLTFRAAWMASFINYDLPTEFLVYAHAGPAIKWVLDDIEEMSLRMTDGLDLKFVYDDEVSWPYSWYFRNFTDAVFVGGNPTVQNTEDAIFVVVGSGHRGDVEPILEDRYIRRDHMRMWWPMQEYFRLTPQRIFNVLDFSPQNTDAAALRKGIFDIWWSRDYELYGEATGKDFSLTNWPVSDRMHVYIRKDFASMIWEYGIGDGDVPSMIPQEINQCAANWRNVTPLVQFDAEASTLLHPLALTVADGKVYIADESANLIHAYTTDGDYLESYGETADYSFSRPNSVAILPSGDLLVVDTWNYRILHLDRDGELLTAWGRAGEFGFDAPVEPTDAFWGPRDVALDTSGRIYIADTGNKRIRVYTLQNGEAVYEFDIGSGGSGPGELDEPSGLETHSDGRLFVADTWNRRVSVFDAGGSHLTDFRVRGWYNHVFNRPYLALDEGRDLLYITDPDGKRILVYNTAGECLGSFGDSGDSASAGQFQAIGGIAVDSEGFVFISDSAAGNVLKVPPFQLE
ncbi:MAG: TIGR03663 family protein [Chloroflexi bacterium]|nr:TIGR03663 family protein [Chloroflexota bacterium]